MEIFFNTPPIDLFKNVKLYGEFRLDLSIIEETQKELFTYAIIYKLTNPKGVRDQLVFLIGKNEIDESDEDICLKIAFEIIEKFNDKFVLGETSTIEIITKNNFKYKRGEVDPLETKKNLNSEKSCLLEEIDGSVERHIPNNFLKIFINLASELSFTLGCKFITLEEAPNKKCGCGSCELPVSLILSYAFKSEGKDTFYSKYGFKGDQQVQEFLKVIKEKSKKNITKFDKHLLKALLKFNSFLTEEEAIFEFAKRLIKKEDICRYKFLLVLQYFFVTEKKPDFIDTTNEQYQLLSSSLEEDKHKIIEKFQNMVEKKFNEIGLKKVFKLQKNLKKTDVTLLSLKRMDDTYEDIENGEKRKKEVFQYIEDTKNLVA
jgi:hypothetical protein